VEFGNAAERVVVCLKRLCELRARPRETHSCNDLGQGTQFEYRLGRVAQEHSECVQVTGEAGEQFFDIDELETPFDEGDVNDNMPSRTGYSYCPNRGEYLPYFFGVMGNVDEAGNHTVTIRVYDGIFIDEEYSDESGPCPSEDRQVFDRVKDRSGYRQTVLSDAQFFRELYAREAPDAHQTWDVTPSKSSRSTPVLVRCVSGPQANDVVVVESIEPHDSMLAVQLCANYFTPGLTVTNPYTSVDHAYTLTQVAAAAPADDDGIEHGVLGIFKVEFRTPGIEPVWLAALPTDSRAALYEFMGTNFLKMSPIASVLLEQDVVEFGELACLGKAILERHLVPPVWNDIVTADPLDGISHRTLSALFEAAGVPTEFGAELRIRLDAAPYDEFSLSHPKSEHERRMRLDGAYRQWWEPVVPLGT
jgi:hypothetical protein